MPRPEETRLVYSTDGEAKPERRRLKRLEKPSRGEPVNRKGGLRIRLDRRASDRVVTVVSGLSAKDDAAGLARALKSACGAGGTVKGDALELQGDHRERVEEELARRGLSFKRSGG